MRKSSDTTGCFIYQMASQNRGDRSMKKKQNEVNVIASQAFRQ